MQAYFGICPLYKYALSLNERSGASVKRESGSLLQSNYATHYSGTPI